MSALYWSSGLMAGIALVNLSYGGPDKWVEMAVVLSGGALIAAIIMERTDGRS